MNSRVSRLGLLVLCLSWDALQAQDEGENFITHGAILGRLSSDGVGIWARTARTGAFTVRYGDAPDRLYHAVDVPTLLEHDNTGWTRLSGLEPNTRTYYELGIPGSAGSYGREGSFRTLPDSRPCYWTTARTQRGIERRSHLSRPASNPSFAIQGR